MSKLIVANWKMNVLDLSRWAKFKAPKNNEVVICPAFPTLGLINKRNLGVRLGGQDLFWENVRSGGAYTGEVSADMLKQFGAEFVIIGHSERRKFLGETDEMVNRKVKTALAAGLKVILCVGESNETRKKGIKSAEAFVRSELRAGLSGVSKKHLKNIFVAYEPIWAIGTGSADTPKDASQMSSFIKKLIPVKVLYGGSVNPGNAGRFILEKQIDGALVGAASLDPKKFSIIASVGSVKK